MWYRCKKLPWSHDTIRGLGMCMAYVILFVISATAVQAMNRALPDFELNWIRFAVAIPIVSAAMYVQRTPIATPVNFWSHLLLVGVLKFFSSFLFFTAVSLMPLADTAGVVLGFQGFFSIMITMCVAREFIVKDLLSVGGCMLGMLLMIQPWKGFTQGFTPLWIDVATSQNLSSYGDLDVEHSQSPDMAMQFLVGYILCICTSFIEALTLYSSHAYLKQVRATIQVLVMSCLAVPLGILLSLYMDEPVITTDPRTLILLGIHCISVAFGILGQFKACQLIGPTQTSIFGNLETILYLMVQYTLMGDALYGRRNISEVLGCLIIIASLLVAAIMSGSGGHEDI